MTGVDSLDDYRPLARARAYQLLGDLLRRGLLPEHLAVVGEIDELARTVRSPYDADSEGAAHYAMFGHEVFPYESVFRDLTASVGGAFTAAVRAQYEDAGAAPAPSESADHLGVELAFLGRLAELEWAGADTRPRQQRFLAEHLLGWLPALAVAVRMRSDPFWTAVVELALNLAVSHWAETAAPAPQPAGKAPALRLGATLLEDPATGLRDVAGYLLKPARSGLLLARADIAELGRQVGLPRGFGDRAGMLTTLVFGAVDSDRLADLLAALERRLVEWETVFGEYLDLWPCAAAFITPWTARLAKTRELLGALDRRSATESARASAV